MENHVKSQDDPEKKQENGEIRPSNSALGRRDLMKIGAGAVITTLGGQGAVTQAADAGPAKAARPAPPPQAIGAKIAGDWMNVRTGAGYRNDAGRISGNGPMDNTSRQLVSYVTSF